jgi:hypothetical protein
VIHIQPYHLDHGDIERAAAPFLRRTLSFSSQLSSRDPLYRACLTSYETKQGAEALQRFVTLTCALSAAVVIVRQSRSPRSCALDRLATSLSLSCSALSDPFERSVASNSVSRSFFLFQLAAFQPFNRPDASSRAFFSTGPIQMATLSLRSSTFSSVTTPTTHACSPTQCQVDGPVRLNSAKVLAGSGFELGANGLFP